VEPAVDVEALHAKIGQLTLENDFLAAHCWAGLYTASSKRPHVSAVREAGDRIMSGYVNREAVHPGYRLRVWLMP
jgi:hypothetical protein